MPQVNAPLPTCDTLGRQHFLPAEWEPHRATYLIWPNLGEDWSDRYLLLSWLFAEVVRVVSSVEDVYVICHNDALAEILSKLYRSMNINLERVTFHSTPHTYSWARDGGPTAVRSADGEILWIGWSRAHPTDNTSRDSSHLPHAFSLLSKIRLEPAYLLDGQTPLFMEGGAFDTDGAGTLLVTESCLLPPHGYHNPNCNKHDYEQLFRRYLGIEKVLWLETGCAGDRTGGHIDNVARFVGPGKVALAVESNPEDENYHRLAQNRTRLASQTDANGRPLEIIEIPMPAPLYAFDERLPASYLNFYIANNAVLVPTFNDPRDFEAIAIYRTLFPQRNVVGVHSRELVIAGGALHCLTQQEPEPVLTCL